jgi:hypothetical protein
VTSGGPTRIVVRLADGRPMRVPRSWTDADGTAPDTPEAVFSVDALRDLVERVEVLRRRT